MVREGGVPRRMIHRKIFEKIETVITVLELFEQFVRQVLLTFFHKYKSFTKYDTFVRTFSIYVCLRRKNHCC